MLPISDGAKVVARALQVYGGWLADSGEMAAVDAREFGYWAMAHKQRGDLADEHDERVRRMMRDASPEIAGPFLELVSTRRAA